MPISASDISYLYSGGNANYDPDLSLGGDVSSYMITGNRIFNDLSADQAETGRTDYRCIYISNDNATQSLYEANIFINSQVTGGANVTLGFYEENEKQNVILSNASKITGGSFTLIYTDVYLGTTTPFVVNYNANPSIIASNFQTAISAITNLDDVTVTLVSSAGDTYLFEVNYLGGAGKRYHEALTLQTNNLTYSSGACAIPADCVTITKVTSGSPINSIPDELDAPTTAPAYVDFALTSYSVGTFRNYDIIPVWIQRTVPANTLAIEDDGVTIRMRGKAIV